MENPMHVSRFAFLFLILTAVVSASGQEAYTLRYKFAKGKTYRYADTIVANTTQEMMGQEMKMMNAVYAVTRIVGEEAKKDGGAVLIFSMDTLRVSVKNVRMDSTLVPTELNHKRSRLTIDARGEAKKRETIDSVKAGGMYGVGAGTLQQLFRFALLAEKPVKVGEKWTAVRTDTTESMGGKGVSNATYEYTLASQEKYLGRECLKLTYTGKMTITSKGAMGGMDVFTEGNGTIAGTVYFDAKAGLAIAEDGKADVEMTAAVTGQQNMTIPITQSSTQRHVLLPD
jgi:hypothetical protein